MNVFELFATIGLDTRAYDTGLDGAKSKLAAFGSALGSGVATIAKTGAAAIGAATTAVTAFGAASVKTGMSFDASMAQVAATMGKTVDEIQDLRQFAMDMGAKTAFSATQAADALNYMALAGYDADTSMKMLPNVLNLAAAGSMDLAAASDMITDSQSALGLTLDETSGLVDKMAMAASKSNTSVAQLGSAILTVGGTAKNLKGGTTELATALGILADNGVKGAEGGTALRNILTSLTSPTEKASKLMDRLGVSVFDSEGNMRSLNDFFGDLRNSMDDMTQEERMNVISKIFNARDMKSAEAMLANVGDRFNELSGYIDDAAGAADKMAGTQLYNLQGDVTLLQSAMEGAQIVISDQLTPSLREFVRFGAKGVSELADAFKEEGLAGALEAFGSILAKGLAMVIEFLPQAVDAGVQLLNALIKGIVDNLPMIVDATVQIMLMLGTAILDNIPVIFDASLQIMLGLVNGLIDALPRLIPAAGMMITEITNTLVDNMDALVDAAVTLTITLAEAFFDNIDVLISAFVRIVGTLALTLVEKAPEIYDKAPEIVAKICDAFIRNIPYLLEVGWELVKGLAKGIVEAIPHLLLSWADCYNAIMDAILDFFGIHSPSRRMQEIGENIVYGLINGITSLASEVFNTMWNIGRDAIDAFTSFDFWSVGSNIIAGIRNGISDGVRSIRDAAENAARAALEAAENFLGINSPSKEFAWIGKMVDEGMAGGISDNMGPIENAIGEVKDAAVSPFEAVGGVAGFGGGGLGNSSTTNNSTYSPVVNVYGAAGQDVKELAERVGEVLERMYRSQTRVYA